MAPGRWRGGLGTRRDYEILSDDAQLSFVSDRCIIPPFGLHGGQPGAPGSYLVDRGDGFEQASPIFASKAADVPLRRGDVVSQQTAGGGGLGDPRDRPLEAIADDVREGYVTVDSAVTAYQLEPEALEQETVKSTGERGS